MSQNRFTLSLLLFIGTLVISCTPSQRVARLVKKYNLERTDTVRVRDTIVTAGVSKDSTFYFYQKDTVRIVKDNMVLKYYYNIHDSTVYLKGECKSDTIYREYIREVNTVSINGPETLGQKVSNYLLNNLLVLLLILIVIYLAYRWK